MVSKLAKKEQTTIAKSIPSSETGSRVTCTTESGNQYIISNNPIKGRFTLWKVILNGYEKISISDNPLDFDKIIDYYKRDILA